MLTPAQIKICESSAASKLLISGPAGCGKTTAAVERVIALIQSGIPADSILVLTPQRGLQNPYLEAIASQPFAGGEVTPATMGGLARRMCDLFWPLAAETAGFAHPELPPIFLTLETAQYYMAHIVRPMLDQGYFESITIDRNRLYSQILDNLNKAAIVGFPVDEIGQRLTNAWIGDPAQRRVYADAQECASRFRTHCLENNLLDFSLQFEIFDNILWNDATVRATLVRAYRHLVYDNIEEDGARAHDLIEEWLPEFDSALLVSDSDGGFRQFLGADPVSARRFESMVDEIVIFDESFVQTSSIASLEENLLAGLGTETALAQPVDEPQEPAIRGFDFITSRFYPELLDAITAEIQVLIAEDQRTPGEIAVLSPYLSDALRFSLMNRLEAAGIPTRSHRPSRSLRDEPASQALLTLAALAHPGWDIHPARFDVTYALMLALDADLVRSQLLTEITYRQRDLHLSGFDEIKTEMQERLTFALGSRYTVLRTWLDAYRLSPTLPLDHFLRKLFGEVLSQPGFGFHSNLDAVRVASSLIESVKKFRQALETGQAEMDLGKEYIAMLNEGVLAAQYLQSYQVEQNAVLVVPATTFLMMNQPVQVQFWLDAGASGWSERLSQPLTQPFVLSRNWIDGQPWTDADEVRVETEALAHLVSGLLRRCRGKIYLGLPELSETGFEQRGALLRAFQRVLQNSTSE